MLGFHFQVNQWERPSGNAGWYFQQKHYAFDTSTVDVLNPPTGELWIKQPGPCICLAHRNVFCVSTSISVAQSRQLPLSFLRSDA